MRRSSCAGAIIDVQDFFLAQLDAAENIALTRYDRPTRKKAYDTIADRLAEVAPAVFTYFSRRIDVANVDFKGYKPAHAVTEFWNTWEYSI